MSDFGRKWLNFNIKCIIKKIHYFKYIKKSVRYWHYLTLVITEKKIFVKNYSPIVLYQYFTVLSKEYF